ncbi:hypothetical protein GuthCp057 (chloroplast) [Guillardia theta]|uniref:Uncharacterized 7.8 kDa protein n=2 Tax=Guillardia theta TaxID=55529 RepID=YCX5_GUITH|nr:hypothetical protein GuthCp057 [Guillardia theta]O78459.1 RecName: Full=Uncharacterized 7.8 kDa protein; AltName: Full=ORF62 [Guillardia theta]AAC35650.1 unknown [Guillardia theta]
MLKDIQIYELNERIKKKKLKTYNRNKLLKLLTYVERHKICIVLYFNLIKRQLIYIEFVFIRN